MDRYAPDAPPASLGPFETTFGAFIYDKGYRQLFKALGYPGPDAEAALAMERLAAIDGRGLSLAYNHSSTRLPLISAVLKPLYEYYH
jgi:hypothetical protein